MGRVMSGEAGAYNFDSYASMKEIHDILGGRCGAGVVETTAEAARRVVAERDSLRLDLAAGGADRLEREADEK